MAQDMRLDGYLSPSVKISCSANTGAMTGLHMNRLFHLFRLSPLLAAVAATLLLNGCMGGAFELGSSAPPPSDVQVITGDSSVTLTWTAVPGTEYWVFVAPGSHVTPDNWNTIGGFAFPKSKPPYVINGLTNGQTYSFTVNARIDGGPGGAGSPSLATIPRLAGASWSTAPAQGSSNLNGLSFGSQFVAVGDAGALYTSPDINAYTPFKWTTRTVPLAAPLPNLYATVYGGLYLAVGARGTILRSTDAATWTAQSSGTANDLYAIAANGVGGYVAVGQAGSILSSPDGVNWTRQNSGTGNDLYAITYGNGIWLAAGKSGTLLISNNAFTWTAVPSNTLQDLRGVAFGIATSGSAISSTSTAVFIAVGTAGTQLTSRDNGATWTASTINNGVNDLRAITFTRQFITTGNNGSIFTSTDGVQWSPQASGTHNDLLAISHGSVSIAVAGAAGSNLSAY